MRHLFFIINPIAGPGANLLNRAYIMEFFKDEGCTITIKNTKYKGHAKELANEAIDEKVDLIIACGGDGTVNEVGATLIGIGIPMGIIPMGSGNGLASNLQIPKNLQAALSLIKIGKSIKIDAGCVNKRYFFSNMGIGFDAEVIGHYEQINRRGFVAYLKAAFLSFKSFNYQDYSYRLEGKETSLAPFLFFISNSNEMGNNISLTPRASLQDGLLDVIIVPKISRLRALLFGVLLLFKKHHSFRELHYSQEKKLEIYKSGAESIQIQIDGEFVAIAGDRLNISIVEDALLVISGEGQSRKPDWNSETSF